MQMILPSSLAAACPDGIDVYYENVGGAVFKAVMPLLNTKARIPLCGLISQYNRTEQAQGPDLSDDLMLTFLSRRITLRGFIVFDDFGHVYPEFARDMTAWVKEGRIKYREQVVEGLETAPKAFNDLLLGNNFGKVVVKVGEHDL